MSAFAPGDDVYWWARVTDAVELPYRGTVLKVGPRRVTIQVQDPDGGPELVVRHVQPERLEKPCGYFAEVQYSCPMPGREAWGSCTDYYEIGADLWIVRFVSAYENGYILGYDRLHWVDDFGMLGDRRVRRNRAAESLHTSFSQSREIRRDEFEHLWARARSSPMWAEQVATARMTTAGYTPRWQTSEFPSRPRRVVD